MARSPSAARRICQEPAASPPSLLGVSAESALGATLGLLLAWPRLVVFLVARRWAVRGVVHAARDVESSHDITVHAGARRHRDVPPPRSAGIVRQVHRQNRIDTLPAITFWLLVGKVGNRDVAFAVVPIAMHGLVTLWTALAGHG
ncbi:MAG: hypothetical protein QM736_26575 [Vicinamibacterales bacterium]